MKNKEREPINETDPEGSWYNFCSPSPVGTGQRVESFFRKLISGTRTVNTGNNITRRKEVMDNSEHS